jgi:Tol biopolymer transport system component
MNAGQSDVIRATAVRVFTAIGLLLGPVVAFASPADATYRGPNGLISFAAQTGDRSQLYTVSANGHRLRQITFQKDADATNPDWSPNGRWIVYTLENETGAHLVLIRPDGTHARDLGAGQPTCCESNASFTPNGRRIVYEHFDPATETDALWSLDLATLRRQPITTVDATDPNVSPDGREISFVQFGSGDLQQGLSTVRPDGTHLRRVVPFSADVAVKQDWSPTGTRIVFSDNADVSERPVNVATVRPDGRGLRYLTHNRAADRKSYAGSYSPDSRWIVYRQESEGLFSLWRMHTNGSHKRQILAPGTMRPRFIDWGSRAHR